MLCSVRGVVGRISRNTALLDSQLIVEIGQRNEHALGTLYDRYGSLVYTIALRMSQDLALAEQSCRISFALSGNRQAASRSRRINKMPSKYMSCGAVVI